MTFLLETWKWNSSSWTNRINYKNSNTTGTCFASHGSLPTNNLAANFYKKHVPCSDTSGVADETKGTVIC